MLSLPSLATASNFIVNTADSLESVSLPALTSVSTLELDQDGALATLDAPLLAVADRIELVYDPHLATCRAEALVMQADPADVTIHDDDDTQGCLAARGSMPSTATRPFEEPRLLTPSGSVPRHRVTSCNHNTAHAHRYRWRSASRHRPPGPLSLRCVNCVAIAQILAASSPGSVSLLRTLLRTPRPKLSGVPAGRAASWAGRVDVDAAHWRCRCV